MQTHTAQDFQRWKLDLRRVCGQFDARQSAAAPSFHGCAEPLAFGDLEIARIASNAASIARARSHDLTSAQHCFLVLQTQGSQHLAVGRLEPVEMNAGDVMLLDPATPFEMLPHGFVENLSIHLPRALVRAHLPAGHITGKLSGDVLSVQMVRLLMQRIADMSPGYRAHFPESQAVRQALIALLAPALQPVEAQASSSSLCTAALREIDDNLPSFDLTPDWVAAKLHVSRRHLYRAFASEGHPGVAQVILERRLDHAAELLGRAQPRQLPVGVVAIEAGLADAAHFSRAFSKRFACSPSQFRKKASAAGG